MRAGLGSHPDAPSLRAAYRRDRGTAAHVDDVHARAAGPRGFGEAIDRARLRVRRSGGEPGAGARRSIGTRTLGGGARDLVVLAVRGDQEAGARRGRERPAELAVTER